MRKALLPLVLLFAAAPASAASPTDWTLDLLERADKQTQIEVYKTFIAAHERLREGAKEWGDALRKETKRAEKSLLQWSKENERHWKQAVRERLRNQ